MEKPRTVADLCRVTGLNGVTVRRAIRAGTLPGYQVGRSYVVPAEAFERFCRGDWRPQTPPEVVYITSSAAGALPFVRKVR